MSTSTAARPAVPALTVRELAILNCLALGETRHQIAEQFGVAPETIRSYQRSIAAKLGRPVTGRPFGLTDRHVQILNLVAMGLNNAEIGADLGISDMTVKSHLRTMGRLMGCGDRAGMVGVAYRAGLLRVPPPCMPTSMTAQMVTLARMLVGNKPLGRCRQVAEQVVAWADEEAARQGRVL